MELFNPKWIVLLLAVAVIVGQCNGYPEGETVESTPEPSTTATEKPTDPSTPEASTPEASTSAPSPGTATGKVIWLDARVPQGAIKPDDQATLERLVFFSKYSFADSKDFKLIKLYQRVSYEVLLMSDGGRYATNLKLLI